MRYGQKKWIREYFQNCKPFPEPFSMRQIFYKEVSEIEAFVPEEHKAEYPNWANNFYGSMTSVLAWCFRHRVISNVTKKPISYRYLNIYDDSGASRQVWQEPIYVEPLSEEEMFAEYPMEVWVENNATWNSLFPLFIWNMKKKAPNGFRLNLISCKGWAKAQEIEKLQKDRADETKVILYFTDWDPAGYYMADKRFSVSKILRYLELDVEVVRIGILPEQIPKDRRSVSLHTFKRTDTRTRRFLEEFGSKYPIIRKYRGYEIQALNPPEIRALVKEAIADAVTKYGFEKRTKVES